ncbi:MAG: PKD domain-containing protein [Bacteroidales bacterium]|jgi:hypothetical protein|nr:PKD domain-containing protein [Bacteroidales bacterium]
MKKYYFILLLLTSGIINNIFSQSKEETAYDIIRQRGEICFGFTAEQYEIKSLYEKISIDKFDGKTVIAYANEKEFSDFLKTNKDFYIIQDYLSTSKALNVASSVTEMQNWNKYPSYEVYVEMMHKFATDFPDICKIDTIGYSMHGKLLLAVKISDNVNLDEAEPEFFYTGQMHGDELLCSFLFLKLIDHLLNQYGHDEQVTDLINNLQIYINPLANPDGMYHGGNSDVSLSTRYNAYFIDLNRNFPRIDSEGTNIQPEIQAMIDYAGSHNFVMSCNSHSGAELMNYPYDALSEYPADYRWWELVCREYASNVQNTGFNGYFTDEDNGVTNGFAWYSTQGSRQDYMNYFKRCREVTLELSKIKRTDSDSLQYYWSVNKKAMLDYLQQATYGLRGIITDSVTGEPIVARIFIENYDKLNSHVFSFPEYGDYYRYLFRGDYNITFSADGYKSKNVNISIQNYEQIILNIQLAPVENEMPIADFEYEITGKTVNFINNSYAARTFYWNFGDDSTSEESNPIHTYSGYNTYNVTLTAENDLGTNQITKEIIIGNSLENKVFESLNVFPNPADKFLHIQCEEIIDKINIKNTLGEIIRQYTPKDTVFEINIENLKSGIYLLNVHINDKFVILRFMKK